MFDFGKWFRKTFRVDALLDGGRRPARPNRPRPSLEALEDRLVPTILFQPAFGPETTTGSAEYNQPQNGVPVTTPINLVFLGQYWNGAAGQSQKSSIESQASVPWAVPT